MNAELRKRLEEAAEKYVFSLPLPSIERTYCATKEDFLAGVEFGYKEAIALAKEWIRDRNRHACEEWLNKECADFETDMNKLWEEKK